MACWRDNPSKRSLSQQATGKLEPLILHSFCSLAFHRLLLIAYWQRLAYMQFAFAAAASVAVAWKWSRCCCTQVNLTYLRLPLSVLCQRNALMLC